MQKFNLSDQISKGINTNKKATPSEALKALFVLVFIGISAVFTGYGLYKIFEAMFTSYTLQTIDIAYFTSGTLLLSLFAIFVILGEVKKVSETTAKAVVHLMRKDKPTSNSQFSNFLSNMFPGSAPKSPDFSGSISIIDMENPDSPIFSGDFKNNEELQELRNSMINKMLNSKSEFKGKKMTKQDILNSMSIEELDAERIKAENAEDWLWAATIRDKIAEKKKQ
jgi:hypothetical protein